jgi:hypothetical protein
MAHSGSPPGIMFFELIELHSIPTSQDLIGMISKRRRLVSGYRSDHTTCQPSARPTRLKWVKLGPGTTSAQCPDYPLKAAV